MAERQVSVVVCVSKNQRYGASEVVTPRTVYDRDHVVACTHMIP